MPPDRILRRWPIALLLLLLPLWAVGMFARGYWTPDEPREADIAWNMARQPVKSVPVMAGAAFCEKPPLAYWAAGTSFAVLGKSPAAARLPNLLWALVAVFAVAGLAHACAGPLAALAAGVAAGTFQLSFQVAMWLASDAALVAGVAVALLGAYRGLMSEAPGRKLAWYLLMHAGLAAGFLAKNVIAWAIPGLAIIAFVAWERRWRELLRIEPYVGLALQALVVLPWVLAVADQADGRRYLRIFFWDNLVGRFLPVATEGDYRSGHVNAPFRYLVQLPVFVAPWTFLAAAAVRRAWRGVRSPCADHAAWRWAVCIVVPSTLLLTVSSTARGIYLAPVLPGMALGLGLWAARHTAQPDRFERVCLAATAALLAAVGVAIGPAALVFAAREGQDVRIWDYAATAGAGLAALVLAVATMVLHRRGRPVAMLVAGVLVLGAAMLAAWRSAIPVIDRWQDASQIAARVAALAENRPVALWQADETTVSFIDYYEDLRPARLEDPAALRAALAADPRLLVVVRRTGSNVAEVAAEGLVERETVGIPRGRRYVVMGLADQP